MKPSTIETRLFINNEFVESKTGKTFKISNPATDQEICDVHEASKEDVDLAVNAAEAAFPHWSSLAAHERAMCMFKFAQLVQRDAQQLAELDSVCMGKPVELLKKMDIPALVGVFNYFAGSGYHIVGESSLSSPNFLNVSVRQPYGVVGLIIPWNVPMIMFAFKVAPALICGNTVVLKSSEKAPLSSLKLAGLIKEAGFPPGVVNVVSGFGDPTGTAIGMHMKIRKISFTGSVATGRKILRMAADSNLKNVSLELGGKSPAIIFGDADLDAAARYTHYSINHNSGQHCQANSRVLVQEGVADAYIDRLKTLMAKVTIGDPADPATFQGPQSDHAQLAHIQRLVDEGAKDGGTLVYGGKRHGTTGAFIEPTILKNVPTQSAAYREEIFGPVVIVNTFKDEADVLAEANCTDFGLFCKCPPRPVAVAPLRGHAFALWPSLHPTTSVAGNSKKRDEGGLVFTSHLSPTYKLTKTNLPLPASVYTSNFDRAVRVAKALEAGAVGINCSVPVRAVDMPIGGWKQSGMGKELSLHGLNTYTELKTIFMKYNADPTSMAVNTWHSGQMQNGM
ncbi:Aldehyde dehydrogenase, cytosolic 1 [Cladophialophora carrionii]|uniref:aldehyde dehydrogenase (NAD(+)) n=1 Tax=Cladophialophora carrionii TaxID=86049 RepID=A0A1C1CTF6_9EURO|nr:Aldehyde dehydrogenase, cytosolic 1 [Cladophialophora carrionii]